MRRLAPFAVLAAAAAAWGQDLSREERVRASVVRVRAADRELLRARALRASNASPVALGEIRVVQPYVLDVCGVVVSPDGEIVTMALHPAAPLQIVVTFADGASNEAKLVGTDPRSNLALLRVDRKTPHHLVLAREGPREMQAVEVVGHGAAPDLAAKGTVACAKSAISLLDLYGVSGGNPIAIGGVFCAATSLSRMVAGSACVDEKGDLLGLVFDTTPPRIREVTGEDGKKQLEPYEVSFCASAPRIARILDALRAKGFVERSWFGLEIAPASEAMREQFDLPPCALAVAEVEPEGPAAAAGLERHDVLLGVEGASPADAQEFCEILSERAPGAPATLRILRKGRPLTVEVTPRTLR